MDYQHIAEVMRIPMSTVGVRLRRGKAQLKDLFNKSHPEYEQ
jgi:DNA-directed RNA polymerase specialized sigma24 family protein